MQKNTSIRSPFFYVGDKYKLMPEIKKYFPDKIRTYVEPFVGGGSSFLNINAEKYLLNDIDMYVIELHKYLSSFSENQKELLDILYGLIDKYGLSCSYKGVLVPDELKKQYVKTYYAKFNKDPYNKMKTDFNNNHSDMPLLYLLIIYGFNHMIRFNNSNLFNLPVGNVDFNKNVYNAIINYTNFVKGKEIHFFNMDYQTFLQDLDLSDQDLVYLDPPYLISMSEYNKLWNETKEKELCSFLDTLNSQGVRFAITNLITHKEKENTIFLEWAEKYNIHPINSNYISFNDNTIKHTSKEVLVTNYE